MGEERIWGAGGGKERAGEGRGRQVGGEGQQEQGSLTGGHSGEGDT